MEISLARPLPYGVGKVSQWFGEHPEWYKQYGLFAHNGLDYSCPMGTQVLAAHAGILEIQPYDADGYGNYVTIRGTKYTTLYAHLNKILIPDRTVITAKTPIALSGNSGNSTGPHLHFALKVHGMLNPAYNNYIDPVPFREG